MIPDLTDPLIARQWSLEERMLDAGMSAYRRRVEKARARGDGSTVGAANKLLKMTVGRLAASVEEMVAHAASGAPGKRAIAVRKVEYLAPELVAFVTVAEVLNAVVFGGARKNTVQTIAKGIALRIEDEARLQAFAKKNRRLVDSVIDKLNHQTSNRDHKRTVLVHLLNRKGDEWASWSPIERLHVGTRLIDLCLLTGLVEKVAPSKVHKHKNDLTRLRLTDEGARWIAETDAHYEALAPRYLPMVVPPQPWTGPKSGGFINTLRPAFVTRGRGGGRRRVRYSDAPLAYDAVNAVQATPWRINRNIYEHLKHAWNSKLTIGLPPQELELPAAPSDIETNEEARRDYRRAAKQAHLQNSRLRSKRIAVTQTLAAAELFLDGVSIYFVHHCDFRGRLYAVSTFLSPQGGDVSRALLEFAHGLPVGEVGAGWLAIHGANTYGFDKVSLEERISWVEERNDLIRRTAKDPFADLWWADADKPWCFLAWCFEWAGFLDVGPSFVSRLPIALDGSCNGLQHYSAMLRDHVGGAAVNLVPADKPSDIYGNVADEVARRLTEYRDDIPAPVDGRATPPSSEQICAIRWLNFGIDRKMTKRPVMVLPYGGTRNSCLRYVEEAYLKRVAEGTPDPFTKEDRKAAIQFLASVVWQAIGAVVVAARAVMDWLRSAAKVATAAGVPISWTAPSGFPVVQDYRDLTKRRVKTRLSGSVTFLTMREESDRLCPRRQANGLPPNFVHSLDAAALCHTVDVARANGIEHFAMIHDSYGTHAAKTEQLSACLRHAFVDMYQGSDPLAELEKRLREVLPPEFADRLPPLPERGTLDLQGVLRSDFFFA